MRAAGAHSRAARSGGDPVRTDIHAHCWPTEYLSLLEREQPDTAAGARALGASDSTDDLARRFAQMSQAGIDRQVLSVGAQAPALSDPARAADAARVANDRFAELAASSNGRLRAFVTVPLPHVAEAIAEVRRRAGDATFVGVALTSSVGNLRLSDPHFGPFLAELERLSTVAFVHPAGSCHFRPGGSGDLVWAVGAPIEDTLIVAELIATAAPFHYPHIRFVVPHLGGAVPMLTARFDHQLVVDAGPTSRRPRPRPSDLARQLWYDTVDHGHAPALRAAVDSLGADRLLLGTDYPYLQGDELVECVTHVARAGLRPDDARAILEENADRLLVPLGRPSNESLPLRSDPMGPAGEGGIS